MRSVIVGLGTQGRKRLAVAGAEAVATVDPVAPGAHYRAIEEVPPDRYDAALVCTPDQAKLAVLRYLLGRGKHVLVEKPLVAGERELRELEALARSTGAACYTAYNHRFEPHLARLKEVLDAGTLGTIYLARFYYGNGTAADVKRSPWRDQGAGVLPDLGSHLLDLTLFFFGRPEGEFAPWACHRFETRAFDHVVFGSRGRPALHYEMSLISWRNTFHADIYGELGSAHVDCLCKWGPSTLRVRKRVFPSGRPEEKVELAEGPDPTWAREYEHFKQLCGMGGSNIANDIWIGAVLAQVAGAAGEGI
jgi:predicted dehydrogenase